MVFKIIGCNSISSHLLRTPLGWIMSEIGRQPWIVNGLMKTADGVSPNVSSGQILFSLVSFSLVYTLLAIAMVALFVKYIKQGPNEKAKEDINATDPFNDRGFHPCN